MPCLAFRGGKGVWLNSGPPLLETVALGEFDDNTSRGCREMTFSSDGALFAFADGKTVTVVEAATFEVVVELNRPCACGLAFSQSSRVLAVLEPHATGQPNLHLHDIAGAAGKLIRSFVQKRQLGWSFKWTEGDQLAVVNISNELLFFDNGAYANDRRFGMLKVTEFALPVIASNPHPVAVYSAGSRGQSAHVKIFAYPNFARMLASWSCDRSAHVVLSWNKPGTKLLAMTAPAKDSESFKCDIRLMDVDGSSIDVPHASDGPVYSVKWTPNGEQFCAVYGFEPARATLYDLQGEPIFDFGTGPRNSLYFNEPHDSLLCFGGFKGLGGKIEVWDLHSRTVVLRKDVSQTTHFHWAPDGCHFLTSTLSPNLRYSNGFKLWHRSGKLLLDFTTKDELWDVAWQPVVDGFYPDPCQHVTATSQEQAERTRNDSTGGGGDSLQISKQLRGLQKKLQQITKLKAQRDAGKSLELNQMQKLDTEKDIVEEIARLQL